MSVDNALLEVDVTPYVRGDVEIIAWLGDEGFLEYKAGQRVTERITNLGDYQPAINVWIDAASQLPQPLALFQAQQIKTDMVDALYLIRRKERSVPYGGYVFDTSDEAVEHMTSLLAAQGGYDRIEELINQTNAAFDSTMKPQLDAAVNVNNSNASNLNTWSANMRSNWINLQTVRSAAGIGGSAVALTSHGHTITFNSGVYDAYKSPGGSTTTFDTMNGLTAPSVAVGGNTAVLWQPLSPSSQQWINANVFRDALRAIVSQRTSLQSARAARKNYIRDYCTTIPAVIAYDVVGGW